MAVATPNPNTDYGRELAKWEQHHTRFTSDEVPPGRPYTFAMYPKMLYRAIRHPKTGKTVCMDVQPNPMLFTTPHEYDAAVRSTEELNRQCYLTVQDDVQERNAKNEGWRESPTLALEAYEARMCALAEETGQRHFRDQGMTPKAQAEAAAVDASTEHQVPDVQTEQARIRKRKRT